MFSDGRVLKMGGYDVPVLLVAQRRIEGRLDTTSGYDSSLIFLHDTIT